MGLIRSVEFAGITVEGTYARIGQLVGNKSRITLKVDIYKSKVDYHPAEPDRNLIITEYYDFTPSVSDDALNFIRQGYVHLKTLPSFHYAVDDLDDE